MSPQRKAIVVGAGIGGLAAAAALAGNGWQAEVLEQGERLREEGAGLGLFPNAMRALDVIDPDLARDLRGRPQLLAQAGLRVPSGRWLRRISTESAREWLGDAAVLVRRQELHERLAARLPTESLRLGRAARHLDAGNGATAVRSVAADGSEEVHPADLVILADGVNSSLRTAVDPRVRVQQAGYLTWRGLVPAESAPRVEEGSETWGRGQRFAAVPLSDGALYWYATLPRDDLRSAALEAAAEGSREQLEALRARFADWHEPVPEVLDVVEPASVLRHAIAYLWPLPATFVAGRVALLGDAAHAMTPDIGQGACQALEDAAELGLALEGVRDGSDIDRGLRAYDELRRPRTTRLCRQARGMGRLAQLRNPLAAAVRDRAVGLVPARLASRSLASITAWQPQGRFHDRRDRFHDRPGGGLRDS